MRDETLEAAGTIVPVEEIDESLAIESSQDSSRVSPQVSSLSLSSSLAVAALALATAACGGGEGSSNATGTGAGPTTGGGPAAPTVLKPETDAQAARFILHASIAASEGSIAAVKDQGYEPWLDSQMNLANDQTAAEFFADRGYDAVDDNRYYFQRTPADNMAWGQLLRGNSAVRKRAALALSEFMVVSLNSVNILWRSQAMGAYWDILNQHAFGNFRDLIEAITLNPAMGVFLNTRGNRKADERSGRVPDENYGREVMQLFSIGLYELNIDGTARLDSAGNPIETYDNDDVTEISKAFTGYDYDYTGIDYTTNPSNTSQQIEEPDYARQSMTADPSKWKRPRTEGFHSDAQKSFLGTTIAAGTGPEETLRLTMDALFNHPNVGPFLGKQMIQRLVTSNPSPAYVQRVAQVFNNNGSGVRGDLRAMFKAILLDDEALSDAGIADQTFGKLREPMLRFAQFGRTFGARSTSGNWDIRDLSDSSSRLGQSPLRSPSVFNFFRPGYVPLNSQASTNGMVAPEFQLVNESTVASYVNFMERSIEGNGFWMRDIELPYAAELPIAHDSAALLDRLDLLLTAQQLNQNTRDTILTALNDNPVAETDPDEDKLRQIQIAVLLVMASNDYMVQK